MADHATTPADDAEIHPLDNRESRALDHDQTAAVARGGTSGMTEMGGGPGPENPEHELGGGGTATGNPVAGVTIDEQDRKDAVDGDTGPERPGSPGTSAGHA